MRRVNSSLFIALATVLILTSCSSQSHTDTPSPTSTTIKEPVPHSKIFYVGDTPVGFRLFSEDYAVAGFDTKALTSLVADLVDGKAIPLDPDYSNLWGHGTSLLSLKVSAPLITIDLHLGTLNVGAEAEMRAIDQILWTITKFMPTITGMNLLVDGKKAESIAGHVDATKTFVLEPTFDVLSPLQIESIYEGQSLVSPVIVTGQACTFEANVAWKLSQNNVTVQSGSVTASQACPTRSKWTINLGQLESGKYRLSVRDYSAKDGSLNAEDTKNFIVVKK